MRTLPKLGLCSRTQGYELIRSGQVTVNGAIVTDPDKKVSPTDRILINGKKTQKKLRYILLHKPAGYVTTRKDEKFRPTAYDILGDVGDWVFPVGRLDKETEGLLIFTNDTAFGDYLTNPVNKIPRRYVVTIEDAISEEEKRNIFNGVDIGRGEISRPTGLKVLEKNSRISTIEITLTEGKNREIRRLFEKLGKEVKRLVRISFGPFDLSDLAAGKWCEVSKRG